MQAQLHCLTRKMNRRLTLRHGSSRRGVMRFVARCAVEPDGNLLGGSFTFKVAKVIAVENARQDD